MKPLDLRTENGRNKLMPTPSLKLAENMSVIKFGYMSKGRRIIVTTLEIDSLLLYAAIVDMLMNCRK